MDKSATPFTIIIPTYHESANLPELADRISRVDFGGRLFEVLLVDDNSQDGSLEMVGELRKQYPWLNILVRNQTRDLSQSVIKGFQQARYPVLVTMDADLSHPPEKIPLMLAILDEPNVDIVIGSRYIKGGSVDQAWPRIRRMTSKTAAWLGKIVLFSSVNDPLSGFLAVKKSTFTSGAPLTPIGWKIGLELMVKCRCKKIREIPIHFAQRRRGKSKLNFKISVDYLRHVVELLRYQLFFKIPTS
jgi:dolichol-phosphate mannosyltransferase